MPGFTWTSQKFSAQSLRTPEVWPKIDYSYCSLSITQPAKDWSRIMISGPIKALGLSLWGISYQYWFHWQRSCIFPIAMKQWDEDQLRRFALRFFHSHSGVTGVFCVICRTVYFRCAANLIAASSKICVRRLKVGDLLIKILCITMSSIPCSRSVMISIPLVGNGVILRGYTVSNTVAGRRQFDYSQECFAKKRQWRHHANENTLEQNASILLHVHCSNHYFAIKKGIILIIYCVVSIRWTARRATSGKLTWANLFIPTPTWLLWEAFTARRLFIHIVNTVYSQVLMNTAQWAGASMMGKRKWASFKMTAKEPGSSKDSESRVFPDELPWS